MIHHFTDTRLSVTRSCNFSTRCRNNKTYNIFLFFLFFYSGLFQIFSNFINTLQSFFLRQCSEKNKTFSGGM